MPTNVLLTGGKCKTIGLFSVHVNAATDNSSWHQSEVGLGAGKDAYRGPPPVRGYQGAVLRRPRYQHRSAPEPQHQGKQVGHQR